ncbi:hypothetical protein Tco_0819550 [Tanacetum coccineum]|uniref:Reverse transcriptase domain-containing protein n=1 Tax=Tanacetum coccineum TaxID=301880 RepID=A0ABQ5AB89_9ASTR
MTCYDDDEILFILLALRFCIALLSHSKFWHINWVYTLNLRAHQLYVDIFEYHFQVKLMLSDVSSTRRPLADLRVSLEDLFFGRLHSKVSFMVFHGTRFHLLLEEVIALLFGMHLVFLYVTTMCYDDQSLRCASCFRLRRGVTDWTGGQTSSGGGRTREQTGRGGGRGNGMNRGVNEIPDFPTGIVQQLQYMLPTIVAQVGDHIKNQGINGIQNDNADDDNIHEDVRNVNVSNAYTRWVEKMEAIQDISGCGVNQMVNYVAGSLTDKALTWWNTQVQARSRETAVGMT